MVRSLEFYRNLLGMEVLSDQRWASSVESNSKPEKFWF
jgi:hypothetical protein